MERKMERDDCADYSICKEHADEELNCEDCDNFKPTGCYEDYGGREPFWMKARRMKRHEPNEL